MSFNHVLTLVLLISDRFNDIVSSFSNPTEWISCGGISEHSDCVLHMYGPERTCR